MNTNIKYFKISLLITIIFFGCSKESLVQSKYEQEKLAVKQKYELAKQTPLPLGDGIIVGDCGINVSGKICLQFLHGLEIYVDISECSTAVTDSCRVYGEMEITICYDGYNNMEVNFKESIFGHAIDCIINGNEVHTDDWDCIAEKTYLTFVDYMMPIILDLWGSYNDCEDGYYTVLSSYTKELCTYPCTVKNGAYYYTKLIQCGSSTACCVKKDYWCKDDNGMVHSTPEGLYKIGECSIGEVPCIPIKGDPYPVLDICRPRSCIEL